MMYLLSSKPRFQNGLSHSLSLILMILISLALHNQIIYADACICLDKGLHQSYFDNEKVMLKVKLLPGRVWDGKKNEPDTQRLRVAKVLKNYKDGDVKTNAEGQYILIASAIHSCGVEFKNKDHVVAMTPVPNGGDGGGLGVYEINDCDFYKARKFLSVAEKAFLDTRMICDGPAPGLGSCTCGDGSSPVSCFIDPCESATCDVGTTCVANYCDGCRAEWFDDRGWLLCECMEGDTSKVCDNKN